MNNKKELKPLPQSSIMLETVEGGAETSAVLQYASEGHLTAPLEFP